MPDPDDRYAIGVPSAERAILGSDDLMKRAYTSPSLPVDLQEDASPDQG